MQNKFMQGLFGLCLLLVFGCQLTSNSPAADWTVEFEPYFKRYCIDKQQCAEVSLSFPRYKGEQSATLLDFNERIQRHLGTLVSAPEGVPIEIGFDTITTNFFSMFASYKEHSPNTVDNWKMKLTTAVPLLNSKLTTVEAKEAYVVANKREINTTHIVSYDFRKEKYLTAADLVSDTTAFLPMLEAAFCREQNMKSTDEIKEVLAPTYERLPLPRYIAVVPAGLRVVYNYSEIAMVVIPLTDFTLSWAELEAITDREDWLDE